MSTFIISVILIVIVYFAIKSIMKNGVCGGNCKDCGGSCHQKENNLVKAYYQDKKKEACIHK